MSIMFKGPVPHTILRTVLEQHKDIFDENMSKEVFDKVVSGIQKHPEKYEIFDKSPIPLSMEQVKEALGDAIWGLPDHPSRIPVEYRGLPFSWLKDIKRGYIDWLWSDAPSSRIRHEYLCDISQIRLSNPKYGIGDPINTWMTYPWAWYIRGCFPHAVFPFRPRYRAIAEWILAKKHWVGWIRPMNMGYGPNGQIRRVIPYEILDEVWPTDIVNGPKTSPEKVFRAVFARKMEAEREALEMEQKPFPTFPWSLCPGIEYLSCAQELAAEGDRMNHCVVGYAQACHNGKCFILRLPNSTVEIDPRGNVYQHQGYKNSSPPGDDVILLD